jgi:hypothetical protein
MSDDPAADHSGSVFRAFATDGFEEWPAWRRLEGILTANGGSYGLVGPRGAGKTWLMLRAVEKARESGGMGLWFPSPSEYDPHAFLSSLADNFAAEVERRFRTRGPVSLLYAARSARFVIVVAALALVPCIVLAQDMPGLDLSRDSPITLLLGATLAVAAALLLSTFLGGLTYLFPRGRLVAQARLVQERIRYSTTLSEGTEASAGGGRGLLSFGSSRNRELVERPTTVSSLVHDFRRLGRVTAAVVSPGRVVIAIDELDKMADPDKVRALLRDIKGIFEIEGVHFFVSVSHEAARALQLGSLTERNEFSSSFYTVIQLPPLSAERCVRLLERRTGGPRPELWYTRAAIGVLAAGNPREVIRLADMAETYAARPLNVRSAVAAVLRVELLEFRREALELGGNRDGSALSDREQVGVYQAVRALTNSDGAPPGDALDALWTPEWASDGWTELMQEQWRRMIVRIHAAVWLAARDEEPGGAALDQLSRIVAESGRSATVARLMLTEPPFDLPSPDGRPSVPVAGAGAQ